MHLLITDSGLGGLSVCASIEKELREAPRADDVRITYVNAWPEQGRGYNDMPDPPSRARVFDRALQAMARMRPDLILIACNTLSILYELTEFRRGARVPVLGIVEAGVELFREAMTAEPGSAILLLGTRTTIESGVHRERLLQRGVRADRIAALSCHGLAKAIEHGPGSAEVDELIERCAAQAGGLVRGDPLFAGLCCTHYAMVAERISAVLARTTGCLVGPLDPNDRLVPDVAARLGPRAADAHRRGPVPFSVISKVRLDEGQPEAVAAVIEGVAPATAAALRHYIATPELF